MASLDLIECINGEQMPWWDLKHVQDDVDPYSFRMLEGIFSLDAVRLSRIVMLQGWWTKALKRRIITKTCLYNFDPLKPHFYTVKLGFKGVYIIFRISAQNIDCGYSLEPPQPTIYVLSRSMKNIRVFYLKSFSF